MPEVDFVRAAVVDIARPASVFPRQAVLDAQALYFNFADFADLKLAGGRLPSPYQLSAYPSWLRKAHGGGTKFFAAAVTLGEFVRLVEYADIEARWLTDPSCGPDDTFSPRICKHTRYKLSPTELLGVRKRAEVRLQAARKMVELLPRWEQVADEYDAARAAWVGSTGDFADAVLVANAKYVLIPHILSDDIDLVSFDGITVYTANRHAIDAARQAGKLREGKP